MTRIDMTTRELHGLIAPVLPHTSTDAELPQLCAVRIEVAGNIVYAVATDHYTLAATRHPIDGAAGDVLIHVGAKEAATALKLFPYSKDEDPQLRITVDTFTVTRNGRHLGPLALGLQIDAEDGTRLVLHDQRDPLQASALDRWRRNLGRAIHRDHTQPTRPAFLLNPGMLACWGKSAAKGERFVMLPGSRPADPILICVEDRFIAIWQPVQHIDGDQAARLDGNPWRGELPPPSSNGDGEDSSQ